MTDQPVPPPPKRRRGGQPGNLNGLKHGFYASRFRRAEVAALETTQFTGLADEIALLRLYIRRVVELGAGLDDLSESLQLLRILCLAAGALTRLLKTDHLLSAGGENDLQLSITRAIEELQVEFNLTPPPPSLEAGRLPPADDP
jgi:hypothetical protein